MWWVGKEEVWQQEAEAHESGSTVGGQSLGGFPGACFRSWFLHKAMQEEIWLCRGGA